MCQALDLYSHGLAPFLPEDGTPPSAKAQLFPGLQPIARLDSAVTETWHKRYLLICTSSAVQTPMAWLQAEKCEQDENCRVEIAGFEISLFKAPRQIIITGPDSRTVPLTTMPEMRQNTVKQWGKISILKAPEAQLQSAVQMQAHRWTNPHRESDCLTWEGGHAIMVVIYHVCALEERQATGCWDCKKFSVWPAPRYHHHLLFSSKPSAWGVLLPVFVSSSSHTPSLSFCFSSAEAAAPEVQMMEFTALTPKEKDLQ